MSNWRESRTVAVTLVALFVVVQLAIPLTRVGDDTTRRFGWQMFSVARHSPQFVVTTATGDIAIELDDYLARVRADLDLIGLVPRHLCSVIPGAELVRWEEGEHRC